MYPIQRVFHVDASVQPTGQAAFAVGELLSDGTFTIGTHDLPRGTLITEAEFEAVRTALAEVPTGVPAIVYTDSHGAIDRMLSEMRIQGFYVGGRQRYHRQVIWAPRCQGEYATRVHDAAVERSRYLAQEDHIPMANKYEELVLLTVERGVQPYLIGLVVGQGRVQAQCLPVKSVHDTLSLGVALADQLGLGERLDAGELVVRLDRSIQPGSDFRVSSVRERMMLEAVRPGVVTESEFRVVQAMFS